MPDDIFKWAAARASHDSFFLGYDLRAFSQMNEFVEAALADFLQCSREALRKLALCTRPDPDRSSFRADVEQIAEHCGANPHKLATLLREVDAVRAIRTIGDLPMAPSKPEPGLLMAARDRKKGRRRPAVRERKSR